MSDPDALLRRLESSVLFAPDYPTQGVAAIERTPNWEELRQAVETLGRSGYVPAVPMLTRLWERCALRPVQVAAGHALRRIGTPQARAALIRLVDRPDHLSLFLGVRALFDLDPATVFDRVAPYFDADRLAVPEGVHIPHEILATFCPSSFRNEGGREVAGWTEPRAPAWLAGDERWLELLVGFRRHPTLGAVARKALRYAMPDVVRAALERARRSEAPIVIDARTTAAGDLLSRYSAGEHEAVWRALRNPEAIGGDFRAEALAVADATMRRVAAAADRLAKRLEERGWVALSGSLRTLPTPADAHELAEIERVTGAQLPPSLLAFWTNVGGIDFVWDYNGDRAAPDLGLDLDLAALDPLCVDPPGFAHLQLEEFEEAQQVVDPDLVDPFELALAPDALHKANISGGPPYHVVLPFLGADPIFAGEPHGLPFVDYLRLAFRWGGFPGLRVHADRDDVRRLVHDLTVDLEPF